MTKLLLVTMVTATFKCGMVIFIKGYVRNCIVCMFTNNIGLLKGHSTPEHYRTIVFHSTASTCHVQCSLRCSDSSVTVQVMHAPHTLQFVQ